MAIYVLLVGAYFMACLVRNSSGVVLPEIAAKTGFDSGTIGLTSSLYFYGYALAQPFIGGICDKYKAAKTCALGMLLFAGGIFLFGVSSSPMGLGLGRFLTGLGAGPTFCGIMVHQTRSFATEDYPMFTGISVALGHLGGVAALYPMRWGMEHLGQFRLHAIIVALAIVISILLFTLGKGSDADLYRVNERGGKNAGVSPIHGFKILLSNTNIKMAAFIWAVAMSLQLTLMGLWGVRWMTNSLTMDAQTATFAMSLASAGVLIGSLCAAVYGRRLPSTAYSLKVFSLLLSAVQAFLIISIHFLLRNVFIYVILLSLGCLIGFMHVLCNAFVHKTVEKDRVGAVIGAINTVLFCSVLVSQWVSGIVIDNASYFDGYFIVFSVFVFLPLFTTIM
jgi:MFS family permease